MSTAQMPAIFFGHGSPMIALENNATTKTWAALGLAVGTPKAILCVSAHWLTRGTAVTAMPNPKTIHDFGAFPRALFEVQYPAPGSPQLARRVQEVLAPLPVHLDEEAWGLDHGTWSVLGKAFPSANIPVVQLSMDATRDAAWHYALGRRLRVLRDEGVLIVGSGNIVHNLPRMDFAARQRQPYDWAERFNNYIRNAIAEDAPLRAVNYESLGSDAALAVPTPDHYWPLLYVLGARGDGETARFLPDHIEHGSLSMTSVLFGETPLPLVA
ncbi:MAG: 4,5-DOPA dioxygenase extradiol [Caulobacterales bacterium]